MRLKAVFENQYKENAPSWVPPAEEEEPYDHAVPASGNRTTGQNTLMTVLDENTSPRNMALFLFNLILQNGLTIYEDLKKILGELESEEGLILGGGLQIIQGDTCINPGCCCDLQEWDEWLILTERKDGPWMGHDPAPWFECTESDFTVWANHFSGDPSGVIHVTAGYKELEEALYGVHKDLQHFYRNLVHWIETIHNAGNPKFFAMLEEFLKIHKPMEYYLK